MEQIGTQGDPAVIRYAEILIINDMPDQIALLSSLLGAEGYRVFAATSGKAAAYFLARRVPDLILLDIQMGDVSGLEICRKVKADARLMNVPIVFLTSETSVAAISQCFELGASDYIRKLFSKGELLARIKTHLRVAIQRKELIAANDELSQFCIAVTHDLKAPFIVIRQLIELMQMKIENGEDAADVMQLINMKAEQTQILIERLFEFSKMCNVKANVGKVPLKAIVTETFADLRRLVPEQRIRFSCTNLPNILADEVLVRMAVKNLLQNAIKYSSKKPLSVIRVFSVHDSVYHIIKFRDNGAGFDMRYAGKIFKVLERLHSSDEFPGTGVGLALADRIMQRHNGRIEAYGEVGKCAEFTLYFPKKQKHTDAI